MIIRLLKGCIGISYYERVRFIGYFFLGNSILFHYIWWFGQTLWYRFFLSRIQYTPFEGMSNSSRLISFQEKSCLVLFWAILFNYFSVNIVECECSSLLSLVMKSFCNEWCPLITLQKSLFCEDMTRLYTKFSYHFSLVDEVKMMNYWEAWSRIGFFCCIEIFLMY